MNKLECDECKGKPKKDFGRFLNLVISLLDSCEECRQYREYEKYKKQRDKYYGER